ncbi:Hpt domain-containing protein [Breoghania sp. JC706]|uniref:Hpt domain-containing protein n=1 Tax=Breoghania sp. JC706 TaxID=3117732 RepID=UPI00300AB751
MKPADSQTWDVLFERLRARYVENLPQRLEALETVLGNIEAGADPSALREELTLLAHKMVGSGKTYGFDTISAHARILEDALLDFSNSLEEAVHPADDLIVACRKAISNSDAA